MPRIQLLIILTNKKPDVMSELQAAMHQQHLRSVEALYVGHQGWLYAWLQRKLGNRVDAYLALFRAVLDYSAGNQCRAAAILGINRGTLRKKLRQFGLSG